MREVAIISSVRSAMGKANKGSFKDTRPDTIAAAVIKEAIKRSGVEPKDFEDVIMGCAFPEGEQGMNIARVAAAMAGLPWEVPAMTVNRFCSSGVQAIAIGADRIRTGDCDIVIGGGVESMSMVPMGGNKYSVNPEAIESMPELYCSMGISSENVAQKYNVTREDQDEFAVRSNERAIAAIEAGKFKGEIVPIETTVFGPNGAKTVVVDTDEGPRKGTTMESLAKLRPVFDAKGTTTAGNASQMTDGAGATVLMEAEMAKKQGKDILAYFRAFVVAGVPPDYMGTGPVPAIRKLFAKTGLNKDDIDVFEINEAFASQSIYCVRELGLDLEKVNPNGGAIAVGHPLGATGARMVATIIPELKRQNARYGVVSMCIGGGMGAAALIEMPQ